MSEFSGKRYHVSGGFVQKKNGKSGFMLTECGNEKRGVFITPISPSSDTEDMVVVRKVDDDHVVIERDDVEKSRGNGPCLCSTPEYRKGWDRIFGKKELLN